MKTKICFKCGVNKPIDLFYKHPEMKDGHLNKCIECTKRDVRNKYKENIKDESYVEKERIRGRDKYKRLNYRLKPVSNPLIRNSEYTNLHRKVKSLGYDLKNKEIHHWNYNKMGSIFIVSRRLHKLIHKFIKLDSLNKIFNFEDQSLDTKDKHRSYIMNLIKDENYEFEELEL